MTEREWKEKMTSHKVLHPVQAMRHVERPHWEPLSLAFVHQRNVRPLGERILSWVLITLAVLAVVTCAGCGTP